MKIPEPRRLKNKDWFIQLRLNGVSIPVSDPDKEKCKKKAAAIKAQYKADQLTAERLKKLPTLRVAIDEYIDSRSNTLSPSTIRGYRIIQRNRFQSTMARPLSSIKDNEWQRIVNQEAKTCSPKTLKNAWGLVRSVALDNGRRLPDVALPNQISNKTEFLTYEQIRVFVDAVKDTEIAIPALLALSSARLSEIDALLWENIPMNPKFIPIKGARVRNSNNQYVMKDQNKNTTSTRNIPILIPELQAAIERDRKPAGKVLEMTPKLLRVRVDKICKENNLPHVCVHGLRHSFASLAYHLQIPEKIVMEIGGWANDATMKKIYSHIAQSDITRYQNALADFYASKNTDG